MCTRNIERRMFERRARRSKVIAVRQFPYRECLAVLMFDTHKKSQWMLVINTNSSSAQTYLRLMLAHIRSQPFQLRLWNDD